MEQLLYASEVVVNGLMAGVMYALVALGFVLIYKASGVFNYAQGVLALFAALTLVGIQQGQVPFAHLINAMTGGHLDSFGWTVPSLLAIVLTAGVMVILAILIEKLVLKHLVGQDPIILFMATIGLAYFLEGLGDLMWGANVKTLDVGLPQGLSETMESWTNSLTGYGFFIDRLDIWATVIAALLVAALVAFSQYTKQGRAMRAVADDHQAALSVGISLRFIWVMVWSIAGFVALVAGIMWGTKSGVQFSLSLIALKALPVLMLGGFTSIPGAIVGGLIIGVGEKLFEFVTSQAWFASTFGFTLSATESWFAYVLALIFLVFRPQGLFGEKIIERV
ncbi:branched-chain amino acid ABC transporter permease [Paracoccus sphaerophysae]|uniref:branched-chain amino acid ABC transporter permease n=1 Tax=Paracoccus sphaerophysae TaxID=690417 RepID=UPI003B5BA438